MFTSITFSSNMGDDLSSNQLGVKQSKITLQYNVQVHNSERVEVLAIIAFIVILCCGDTGLGCNTLHGTLSRGLYSHSERDEDLG